MELLLTSRYADMFLKVMIQCFNQYFSMLSTCSMYEMLPKFATDLGEM